MPSASVIAVCSLWCTVCFRFAWTSTHVAPRTDRLRCRERRERKKRCDRMDVAPSIFRPVKTVELRDSANVRIWTNEFAVRIWILYTLACIHTPSPIYLRISSRWNLDQHDDSCTAFSRIAWCCYIGLHLPLPSSRQHLCNDHCPEDRLSELFCAAVVYDSCAQWYAYTLAVRKVVSWFRFSFSLDLGLLFVFFAILSDALFAVVVLGLVSSLY